MILKVTVYNERDAKPWSVAFTDSYTTTIMWLDYCMNELRLGIIQGFTISQEKG